MAGGEGTRLRPLTSNAPKPMLPVANRPMMEHIIYLLRRHGFDEIVVTVAFMANAIKNYFGDGSRVRRAASSTPTSPSPLGTAGSVRNAMEHLDERFLVISGDVITDIDLTKIVALPRRPRGDGHHRPRPGREPARVRHRDHPRGRHDRALPGEADVGPGVQRHHQHRHLRARARRSSTSSTPGAPSTSPATCSRALLADGKPLFGAIAEGYWEDVGTLEAYLQRPQGRARPARAARHPGLPDRRRRVAGRGRRDRRPTPRCSARR